MAEDRSIAVDLLLTNADFVVTCDKAHRVIKNGAVAVKAGKISAVGPSHEIIAQYRSEVQLDMSGHILMPGLVNCHVHAPMTLFRGLGDDLPLEKWLFNLIFPAESRWMRSSENVYLGALLACSEMLLGGTTTFCDGYFFEEQVALAAEAAGIRAVVAQGILDFPTPDCPNPERRFKRAEEFLSGVNQTDMIFPALFCHAPYTCSPETIGTIHSLCRHHNIPFLMHLSETSEEVNSVKAKYGVTPGRLLQSLGVIDRHCIFIHGVWLDDDELKTIKDRGSRLVHCPESNLKLASGIANVPKWLDLEIPFGIGTDGAASNNNLDMFGEMRTAAQLHKGIFLDPTLCNAAEILHSATLKGAEVLGLEPLIGSIEPGKYADIIALSLKSPHLTPLYDPLSHIVYAAKASDVRHVWVGGKQVVYGGTLLSVDVQDIIDSVEKLSREILKK
ncbi:amidohydrolase family protein [Thermodesulforhabdus norvegica]|uniref:5-methylthioadenosine/S-adenosylhomocysteine deaminase n=1 Tax=Thermodesulforhabdus norvegica TaxID=39841 RepID=A0A1I4QJ56_9BACT|nr:amidohydrolase [Thermodesulforhabdus norvegica]SFM39663.1 5-methylthioadenosine/S-adenosylhomocysteine deaminase [Thermodesulforhabdus norvegica]